MMNTNSPNGNDSDEQDVPLDERFDRIEDGRLPMGIDKLDNVEFHGLPEGSLVVVMGDERTMSNLFCLHLASTGRPTQYISTLRSPALIREEVERIAPKSRHSELKESLNFQDLYNDDDPEAQLKTQLSRLKDIDRGYLVIESINEVNWTDKEEYLKFIRKLHKNMHTKTNGVAMIHLQKSMVSNLTEEERSLLNLADVVLQIESDKNSGDLEHDLRVYKMRGMGRMPSKVYKLKLGDDIHIDASRDIGRG